MLRPVILTRDHNIGWNMRDANGAFGFVDMLSTGTTGPIRVNAQIFVLNFDVDLVVNDRKGPNTGKAGVASGVGVKG